MVRLGVRDPDMCYCSDLACLKKYLAVGYSKSLRCSYASKPGSLGSTAELCRRIAHY